MKGGKAKADTRRTDSRLKSKGAAAAGKKQSKKAAKDPNKPKRPASAFFVFMEEFRKQYAKEHPNNKAVSAVGKAGGEKWKSMSESDKAPYVAKAEKRKTEYNKTMQAYNKKLAEGGNGTMRKSPTSPSLKCTMMRMKRTRAARMKMMMSRLTCMEGREPLV